LGLGFLEFGFGNLLGAWGFGSWDFLAKKKP